MEGTTTPWTARTLSPEATWVFIVASTLVLLGIAVTALLRARQRAARARAARASMNLDGPLVEGAAVVSGTVEHAPGHAVAVRVEITQRGEQWTYERRLRYRWREVKREVLVAPFYLRRADGTRIRVEPDGTVELADALDTQVRTGPEVRVVSAELVPGEVAHVRGVLERAAPTSPSEATGYRDGGSIWLLRPARTGMLASTTLLGVGLRERAAYHDGFATAALAGLVVVHASMAGFYADTVPGGNHFRLSVLGFAVLVLWGMYAFGRGPSRPWFRRRLDEQGTGPLRPL